MNSTQVDFLADQAAGLGKVDARTQNEIVRDYLKAHPNEWVAMPILAKLITQTGVGAAVHSRIANCRQFYGMQISNKVRRTVGRTQSFYRYEPAEPAHQA